MTPVQEQYAPHPLTIFAVVWIACSITAGVFTGWLTGAMVVHFAIQLGILRYVEYRRQRKIEGTWGDGEALMPHNYELTMRGGPKDGTTVSWSPSFGELPKVLVFQGLFGPERVFGIHDYRQTGPREYTWVDLEEESRDDPHDQPS